MNNTSNHPPAGLPQIRCPRLGHQINFSYCQSESSGLPCFKTLDCWHHYFDVHAFIKEQLSAEDFNRIFENTGKPKISSLLDLIEQARKNRDK